MAVIHQGDGIQGLATMDPGTVDLVLSDLPSGETAAPFDKRADLEALWPAIWHALKPNGVAVLMASSLRFAMRVIEAEPNAYRYDWVWRKSLPTGFMNAKKMPLRSHEFVLVFYRHTGAYHPQFYKGPVPITANRPTGQTPILANKGRNYGGIPASAARAGEVDRYPNSVLDFPSLHNGSKHRMHPQQKPEGLLAYLVRTYSSPGDLVADPYAGSGSTGRAAETEGRAFVGWELEQEFVDAANSFPRSLFEVGNG